jgi:hypothetical protein
MEELSKQLGVCRQAIYQALEQPHRYKPLVRKLEEFCQ